MSATLTDERIATRLAHVDEHVRPRRPTRWMRSSAPSATTLLGRPRRNE
jgi:hypothetical protein